MFSQLLDRKLVEFQNRTPSISSTGNPRNRADTDDIKDDYIAAIRSHSPIKQLLQPTTDSMVNIFRKFHQKSYFLVSGWKIGAFEAITKKSQTSFAT